MKLDWIVSFVSVEMERRRLQAKFAAMGVNIVSVPKTIDNDIWGTDISFGFDSAVSIATDAIDRLHSTASSHKRVMVIEVMGHKAGWIALYSGMAGGGDVILVPEIAYDIKNIGNTILERLKERQTLFYCSGSGRYSDRWA